MRFVNATKLHRKSGEAHSCFCNIEQSKARFQIQQMRSWGLRPIVFVPGTLWRTWGTRPIPIECE